MIDRPRSRRLTSTLLPKGIRERAVCSRGVSSEGYRRSRSSDSMTASRSEVISLGLSATLEIDQPFQESAIPSQTLESDLTPLSGNVETQ